MSYKTKTHVLALMVGFFAAWVFVGFTCSPRPVHAQSALTTSYSSGEAWDCAGVTASCPKPIGTIDGTNKVFTFRSTPAGSGSVDVYLNGLWQRPCAAPNTANCGYTVTTNTAGAVPGVTMTNAPRAPNPPGDTTGDQLDFRYRGSFHANVLAN